MEGALPVLEYIFEESVPKDFVHAEQGRIFGRDMRSIGSKARNLSRLIREARSKLICFHGHRVQRSGADAALNGEV